VVAVTGFLMRKRIRDLVIELLIAVSVVCLIIFSASRRPGDSRVAFRWVGLAAWTGVAFAYPMMKFRPYWRKAPFWLTSAVLLAIHLAAYVLVFQRMVVDMGSLLIFVVTMAEIQAIVAALKLVVRFCAGAETPPSG